MADPTPTLDATLGGPNSNSYVTLAEADAYFQNSALLQHWANHSDAYKEAALIQATQYLDALTWAGKCCTSTQALQWPRQDVTCRCREAVCTAIPRDVKNTTYELAYQLVHDPDIIVGTVQGNGKEGPVRRQKLDVLEVEYFEPASSKSSTSRYSPSAPLVLQTFPWISDMLGCWSKALNREVRLYRN